MHLSTLKTIFDLAYVIMVIRPSYRVKYEPIVSDISDDELIAASIAVEQIEREKATTVIRQVPGLPNQKKTVK